MADRPKVLLTTACLEGKPYDYYGSNTPQTLFRLATPRLVSAGLRFIKQNIPIVEILEYPSWAEYRRALKRGWDVVGFSFLLHETHQVLRMVEEARREGIRELWAGNYGALTQEIQPFFDRIFIGYAEQEIAQVLGYEIGEIIHPPLIFPMGLPFWKLFQFGFLNTTRGCSMKCSFCQTPVFTRTPVGLPLTSIERLLKWYQNRGIVDLVIPDENFGVIPSHARRVTELLAKYRFLWTVMTRVEYLLKHIDEWVERGLAGVMIGVESLEQKSLDVLCKNSEMEKIYEVVKMCNERGIVIVSFNMIALESDTEESIKANIKRLQEMQFDLAQVCVLTPLPRTPLWDHIQGRYGIDTGDYSRFDCKHLVWNHPLLGKDQVDDILKWSFHALYPRGNAVHTLRKHVKRHMNRLGSFKGISHVIKTSFKKNTKHLRQTPFLASEGRDFRTGNPQSEAPVVACDSHSERIDTNRDRPAGTGIRDFNYESRLKENE